MGTTAPAEARPTAPFPNFRFRRRSHVLPAWGPPGERAWRVTPRDRAWLREPRGREAGLWDPIGRKATQKGGPPPNLKISVRIGADKTKAELSARSLANQSLGSAGRPGRGKGRNGSAVTCRGVWWEEQLLRGRLVLPVSGSRSGAQRGALGDAGL